MKIALEVIKLRDLPLNSIQISFTTCRNYIKLLDIYRYSNQGKGMHYQLNNE